MKLEQPFHSAQETEAWAAKMGQRLRGGEVIELISDLGGGKTTFTRGLARGAGSKDHVSSPTFTISNLYTCETCEINHMDFYRLGNDPGLIKYELEDVLSNPRAVLVVEWSDVIKHILPEKRLSITITVTGDESRVLSLDYPPELNYLVEKL